MIEISMWGGRNGGQLGQLTTITNSFARSPSNTLSATTNHESYMSTQLGARIVIVTSYMSGVHKETT